MKKLISIFLIIYVNLFAIFAQDSLAIDKDCAELKKYMQEASIDCSIAIDEGLLDVDDVIQKIKVEYDSVKNKDKRDKKNSKGIYPSIFASSIKNVLQKELPYKNFHMLMLANKQWFSVFDKEYMFFSEVYLEKKGEEFIVEESNVRSIKKGMKYTGKKEDLYKCIYQNKELYRYGIFLPYIQEKAEISIDNKTKKVPVQWFGKTINKKEVEVKRTEESILISIGTCSPKNVQMFSEEINKFRSEIESTNKTIIIDFRSNQGGDINNILFVLYSIFFEKNQTNLEKFKDKINGVSANNVELNTELLKQRLLIENQVEQYQYLKKYKEKYLIYKNKTGANYSSDVRIENSKYNKKLYILTNYITASAAELFMNYADIIYDEVIIVGENTFGSLDFADPSTYKLPNSEIVLFLTSTDVRDSVLSKNWKGEGKGFYPDYWATSEEIVDTIVYLTKDEELRIVLKDLEKGQK